jgi:hypothetical protein
MHMRFAALAALVLIPSLRAAEAAKVVAPYLDDQTVAVAHIDLSVVEVDEAAARIAKAGKFPLQQLAGPRESIKKALSGFRDAGATDVYVVFSMDDLPFPGPFLIVPRTESDDRLKGAFSILGMETVEPFGNVMFAGGKKSLERLKNLKPAARPDLEPAFAAVPGAALQVALVPSGDQRRVVSEVLPTLPKELGGGPGAIVTKGIRWVALGAETKPKLSVKVVVQAADKEATKALDDLAEKGLDLIMKQPAPFADFKGLRPALAPKIEGDRLVVSIDESNPGVVAELSKMAGKVTTAKGRAQSSNNLKQIALAWHNYASANGKFPEDIKSKDGMPLLSWRVAILPYLEQNVLYQEFKLDEPWDSEHNKKLMEKLPQNLRSPAQKGGDWKTTYLAPTGMAGKAHIGVLGTKFQDITDGTSNTFLVVETNDEAAVEWTKPDDLKVEPRDPLKGLIGHYEQGFLAAFADGSVRFISRGAGQMNILGMFTRDGGEVIQQ